MTDLGLKNLKKKFDKIENDLDTLFSDLSKNNIIGDRVKNFKGFEIYKARLRNSSSDKGKSSGFRVIYYLKRNNSEIIVLTIYYKSQKTNISKNEILNILKSEI